jgi:hypothetical protein
MNVRVVEAPRQPRRVSRRRIVPRWLLLLAFLCVAGLAVASCGEGDSATEDMTGYWSWETDEETTVKVEDLNGEYTLKGLSPSAVAMDPADDGGYVIPDWRWRGRSATASVRLADGGVLTFEVVEKSGGGEPATMLTMDFVRASDEPDVLDTRIADQETQYKGALMQEGAHNLQVAVQSWQVDHDGEAPPVDEVQPGGGIAKYVEAWPDNPYSGGPMEPGKDPGDYTYERVSTGRGYRITGHLQDGDFTVP